MVRADSSSGQDNSSDNIAFIPVQLGFAQDLEYEEGEEDPSLYLGHNYCDWRSWDGGQIGGSPSWLNPRDLPIESPIKCRDCGSLMRFIAQLYAPVNDDEAFHRTLYIFACPSSLGCQNGVAALRCQLPQVNDFYPQKCSDDDDEEFYDNWDNHLCPKWNVNTCTICHQRASGGKCPKSQKWFCCRDHQVEYHTTMKKEKQKNDSTKTSFPSLLKKMELVVEEEPPELELADDDDKDPLFDSKDEEEDEDDANLEQDDLNQIVGMKHGGTSDQETLDFYSRIGRAGGSVKDQCLRYQRWPDSGKDDNDGPLWISSIDKCPIPPPPCPYCGAERKFEVQILPQMLHFLLPPNDDDEKELLSPEQKQAFMAASDILERNDQSSNNDEQRTELKERHDQLLGQYKQGLGLTTTANNEMGKKERLDWGTIAVYTCTASCSGELLKDENNEKIKGLGAYRLEYAWRQPGLD